MNLAEAAANRELVSRVDSLERELADVKRRLDDLSAAEQLKHAENQRLKKSG
jgi:hypothetical protein